MLADILDLENEAFTCPWSENNFREAFDSPHITVFAAVDETAGNALTGFSCLMSYDSEGEILNIAVRLSARKHGIGQMLMDAMLNEGTSKGVTDFFLEVRESNAAARHLYEKNGFESLGVRKRYYSKPVEDAVIMRKTIVTE